MQHNLHQRKNVKTFIATLSLSLVGLANENEMRYGLWRYTQPIWTKYHSTVMPTLVQCTVDCTKKRVWYSKLLWYGRFVARVNRLKRKYSKGNARCDESICVCATGDHR